MSPLNWRLKVLDEKYKPVRIQAKQKTPIEFIEDARCLYTHFTSNEGVPHQYMIGLIKIRIPETGEEVWTWRTAVEITK